MKSVEMKKKPVLEKPYMSLFIYYTLYTTFYTFTTFLKRKN